jgi:hypothetical protein
LACANGAPTSLTTASIASVHDPTEEVHAMTFTTRTILLIVAVVLFLLAAFGIGIGGISLLALGLAAFAAAFIVPDLPVGSTR